MSIADLRREYRNHFLTEQDAAADPLTQFTHWFEEAQRSELLDANAMTLATVSATGEPSARTVLLKGVDDLGFVFFTNYESAKARDLAENPRACLLFFWAELERQVRITGAVSRVSREESSAYFRSRPRESQSAPGCRRKAAPFRIAACWRRTSSRLTRSTDGDDVPVPPFWGGSV